ncbi:N-acetylmuramoyl-L-alanine amidase [bacterium]|nr:N-acetylmuramoyl-L-alanine amidase [bacterium]
MVFFIIGPITLGVWAGCRDNNEDNDAASAEGGAAVTSEAADNAVPEGVPTASPEPPKAPVQLPVALEKPKPAPNCTRVKCGKAVFELPWTMIDGKKLYRFDDDEVQSLCTNVGCRLTRSYIGSTVMANSYGHQVVIVCGETVMRVNGEEKALVGKLIAKDDTYYIDGTLLWYMLGMKPSLQDGTVVLRQTLYSPRFVDEGGGRRLILATAGSLSWDSKELDDGSCVFTIFGTVWPEPKTVYDYDDLHVEISNTKSGDAEVKLSCMDSWILFPRKGLRTNELIIGLLHNYPRPSEPCQMTGLELREDEVNASTLVFNCTGGYWYHWLFDAKTRTLRIDFAGVRTGMEGDVDSDISGLKSCRIHAVGDNDMAVTRFAATVKAGYKVEIEAAEGTEGELRLRVSPGSFEESLYDEGYTNGYVFARGIIVLDPGHGGGDSGCLNRGLGLQEKDITLDVAWRLRTLLEENGWTVLMTRETDTDVSWRHSPDTVELQARCDVANDNNAMWFISLHCNANTSSGVNGSSVYWYKRADKSLAKGLQSALGSSLGLRDMGLLRDGFYVLRHTAMPACLIEMAFLTNPYDAKLLGQESFRQRIAENLAEAIESLAENE